MARYGIGTYYSDVMGSWTLHKKAQTAHIWLITGNIDRGATLALSTWIRNAAMTFVLTTSSGDICGAWRKMGVYLM